MNCKFRPNNQNFYLSEISVLTKCNSIDGFAQPRPEADFLELAQGGPVVTDRPSQIPSNMTDFGP